MKEKTISIILTSLIICMLSTILLGVYVNVSIEIFAATIVPIVIAVVFIRAYINHSLTK